MNKPFEIQGDGYLRKVKAGVWGGCFSLGYDNKAKKYACSLKHRFHCSSKTEAKRMMAECKAELERNQGKPSKAWASHPTRAICTSGNPTSGRAARSGVTSI